MRKGVFDGRIQGGKLTLRYPQRFTALVRAIGDGPARLSLSRLSPPRSIPSNRYYFGCVVRTIADDLGYPDTTEMHDLIAFKFLRVDDDPVTGAPRRKRTHLMTSAEFSEYVSRVILWAETDMGIKIPRPGEWDG